MYYRNIKDYEVLVGLSKNANTGERYSKSAFPVISAPVFSALGKGIFLALMFTAIWACFV